MCLWLQSGQNVELPQRVCWGLVFQEVIKMKGILTQATTELKLENIRPSEMSRPKRTNAVWLHWWAAPRTVTFTETESRVAGARGWGCGHVELVLNGDRLSVWEDEQVPETDGGDGCTITGMYKIIIVVCKYHNFFFHVIFSWLNHLPSWYKERTLSASADNQDFPDLTTYPVPPLNFFSITVSFSSLDF